MCGPAALAIAGASVSALGQGYSALVANANYRAQAKQAAVNAREASASAADAIERGNIEQQRQARQVSRQLGEQRAAMAANGLDISFGSAADVIGDTAMIGQEDSLTIGANAQREARGYAIEGANYLTQRKSAKSAASAALVKGAFDMGSTILGGAQQYRSIRARRAMPSSPSFG